MEDMSHLSDEDYDLYLRSLEVRTPANKEEVAFEMTCEEIEEN